MVKFDLEGRTTEFAKAVIALCLSLKKDVINQRLINQVVGSAGSVGANYKEANDSLGKKDFIQRLKISRREAKETLHWLHLILAANGDRKSDIEPLLQEGREIKNILSAIIIKAE